MNSLLPVIKRSFNPIFLWFFYSFHIFAPLKKFYTQIKTLYPILMFKHRLKRSNNLNNNIIDNKQQNFLGVSCLEESQYQSNTKTIVFGISFVHRATEKF